MSDVPPMGDGTFTVTTTCGGPNEYDGRLGVRISAIFVILVGSMLGMPFTVLIPVLIAHTLLVLIGHNRCSAPSFPSKNKEN